MRGTPFLAAMPAIIGLGGCASMSGLQTEIAAIEARVQKTEQDISSGTSEIGAPGQDVRAQISYRPIIAWAAAFSSRAAADRMIQFRQTARDGNLYERRHECRFDFPTWHRHDGKRAWIHESDSTKVNVEIGNFTVQPTASGLDLRANLGVSGKTQVGANFRLACGPSVGGNIGVSATAKPAALMRMVIRKGPDGVPQYSFAIVSPDTIGLEMRAHFNWFDVGFTIPMKNLARELASGELDLLYSQDGKIILPGGHVRNYHLATADPSVATSTQGLSFNTDVTMVMDQNSTEDGVSRDRP